MYIQTLTINLKNYLSFLPIFVSLLSNGMKKLSKSFKESLNTFLKITHITSPNLVRKLRFLACIKINIKRKEMSPCCLEIFKGYQSNAVYICLDSQAPLKAINRFQIIVEYMVMKKLTSLQEQFPTHLSLGQPNQRQLTK